MRRVHLTVHGRVQGVFYRVSTQAKARELGLTGWVRNLDDGSVEAEAQGPSGDVDDVITWANTGPGQADVESVDVRELDPIYSETEFEIR